MLDRLPIRFDPVSYTGSKRLINGTLGLKGMDRLGALLANREGGVELELEFGVDTEGVRFAHGYVRGEVQPICQRCLSAMATHIDVSLCVAFVTTEAEIKLLPERYDPYVSGKEEVDLKTLVEDEIILALPDVPLHAAGEDCVQIEKGIETNLEPELETEERVNPFAALAQLKQK
ncbi:MAG: hypothetical protein GXP22_02225 [Gammaproteobacteria bacterium]|nr:hypothetical protein [Gammaproteobacteria bacterium]